ncbi:hypothetical protein ACFQQB_69740 [Nonomuraea rubra]|uniref:hypothetical protein n=1 Tax=Nonomuraea rubra TaxID=46180 RepID=UPI0036099402
MALEEGAGELVGVGGAGGEVPAAVRRRVGEVVFAQQAQQGGDEAAVAGEEAGGEEVVHGERGGGRGGEQAGERAGEAVQEGVVRFREEAFVAGGAPGRADAFELLAGTGEDDAGHGQCACVVPARFVRGGAEPGAVQGDGRLPGIEFATHMTTVRA